MKERERERERDELVAVTFEVVGLLKGSRTYQSTKFGTVAGRRLEHKSDTKQMTIV
jgi:hypothetical protein